MSPESILLNKLMLLDFMHVWLHAFVNAILKPLMELPPNFEIWYADEDSCCSVDVDVDIAGASAWGIIVSILYIINEDR